MPKHNGDRDNFFISVEKCNPEVSSYCETDMEKAALGWSDLEFHMWQFQDKINFKEMVHEPTFTRPEGILNMPMNEDTTAGYFLDIQRHDYKTYDSFLSPFTISQQGTFFNMDRRWLNHGWKPMKNEGRGHDFNG